MHTSKYRLFFILIFVLGIILRFWQLDKYPPGFYSDEALNGYEAYSILKTGRDEYGNKFPLNFAAFGEYRNGLLIYTTVPFILGLGLTEFATRLPSALYSSVTVLIVYLLSFGLFKNRRAALLAALLYAVSSWSLQFARMSHETNLSTLLVASGIYFLLKYIQNQKSYFGLLSALTFGLSVYAYYSPRVFVPLLLVFIVFLYRKTLQSRIKTDWWIMAAGSILIIPLIVSSLTNRTSGWFRVEKLVFWSDPGIVLKINENRGKAVLSGMPEMKAKLIHNKITYLPLKLAGNILNEFDPNFLLINGDPNGLYNTPSTGILFWIEPLLIIIALAYLWRNNRNVFWLISVILFLSIIPDALTKVPQSSARIHIALPFALILSGIGLNIIFLKYKTGRWLVILFIALNCGWFWKNYIYNIPWVNGQAWQLGTKEMILKAQTLEPFYKKIWISRSGWGWSHLLFHTKYDPAVFQKEVIVSSRNDLGFWWVTDIGKYHLDWLPDSNAMDCQTLYIGRPEEFMSGSKPLEIINDNYGNVRFWMLSPECGENLQDNGKSDTNEIQVYL